MSLELTKRSEDNLKFLNSYVVNDEYKNLLKLSNVNSLQELFTQAKALADSLKESDKLTVSKLLNAGDAYALKRDITSCYANRFQLYTAAIDGNMYSDANLIARLKLLED